MFSSLIWIISLVFLFTHNKIPNVVSCLSSDQPLLLETLLTLDSMAIENKGTLTLGLELQSIISRGLDENNHVLMASLDLSAALY